jgi:hypothetical protein
MEDNAMPDRTSRKTYGEVSAEKQKDMTGLEFVQGLAQGPLPLNTMAQTLNYDITEAENGRVVVTANPKDIHLNPWGTVHGGLAATMLDSCMGLASSRRSTRVSGRQPWNSKSPSCDPSHSKPA